MTDQHDHHAPSLPGWTSEVAASLRSGLIEGRIPGRVVRVDRGEADVATGGDDVMRCRTSTVAKDVVAGDWVAIDPAAERVDAIAPRRTAFVRRAARGAHRPQTLAANADMVAAVHALQPGFSPRRLERELVIIHESGATPIVVLTKADLVDSVERDAAVESATAVSLGAAVVAVNNRDGTGIDTLRALLRPGATLALIGASGVGKSTIVNRLAGRELMREGEIRAGDSKGRHTTTAARLLTLDGDLLLLDTPGVRALALWESWDGLAATFADIESLAERCRFPDCLHDDEPGCAVVAAAADASLPTERLDSWRKLRDEMGELDAVLTERDRRPNRSRPRSGRS